MSKSMKESDLLRPNKLTCMNKVQYLIISSLIGIKLSKEQISKHKTQN